MLLYLTVTVRDMRKLYSLQKVTKCGLLLIAFWDIFGVLFAMPTVDEGNEEYEEISDKIETFKLDILNGLGYKRPPAMRNVTTSIHEKRKLIQEYRKYISDRQALNGNNNDDDDDDDDGNKLFSSRLYTLKYKGDVPHGVARSDWGSSNDVIRLYFPSYLSHPENDHTKELHVNSAKLRVQFAKVKPENLKDKFTVDRVLRVNVYQILSFKNSKEYTRTLLDSKLISLLQPSIENFEVAKAIESWINNNQSNLGLELSSDSQDINELVEMDMSEGSDDIENVLATLNNTIPLTPPTLDVYAQERDILKRVKRQSRRNRRGDCRVKDGETKCCRYPIKISFKDIGWDDWIIAPHAYKGYYCSGNCPYRHKMANTFAGIKALLHLKDPDRVPSPCCVATKLSPFTILHYDYEGRYQFSEYPDLVVEQCKCG